MSAMEDMFVSMVKKLIPPEVAEKLTPENLQRLGDETLALVSFVKDSLERIENNTQSTLIIVSRMESGGMSIAERMMIGEGIIMEQPDHPDLTLLLGEDNGGNNHSPSEPGDAADGRYYVDAGRGDANSDGN